MDVPEVGIDWRAKGFWRPDGGPAPVGESLFGGGFTWPVLTLRRSAVEHNIATMAAFAARHGLELAPHMKTSMAPGLIAAQLAAGAWACTVATAHQALVLRRLGAPRVLLANLLLDPAALGWLAREIEAGFDAYLQVDSVEGVEAASRAARSAPVPVLVELGHDGGRTGARGLDRLRAVADAAAEAPGTRFAGVTGYEGGAADVPGFLDDLVAAAHATGAGIVSAGGSAWFDVVAEKLSHAPEGSLRVLRSGAYVTHDDGYYREHTPFARIAGELRPALAVWAQVLSTPEPGLAIVGMGKRDAPFDEGLPEPQVIRRAGVLRSADGLVVTRLQDQHCYVEGSGLRIGDLVRFGISHPCTAFDKWRALPVVDDDDVVRDVLETYF
ncbi:alanine racemase [Spirilliplanes yamanashiensis]|uniref:Amino acid deaminase n=1 Tax=Spirilliplanes yamanashiensis TaxID=42233 RepID=A0A8J4DLC3_9ACTN|nr:alanine racemase [Spirilliplanes yamanashiensis]MDP9818643.1 D-serine deaminase-like pyridoxal phosphate-dependent protein [Spirilliplanes yamanashiensis]GIJ05099.1 amino acid deaminase [Spirilliplanes yamanashiensis]